MKIKDIDYIFSHFEGPLFPRNMTTFISNGQFTVRSKEEIHQRGKEADFIDCWINAYPEYIKYKVIIRQPPILTLFSLI
jgi:hypothetical protein